MHISSSFLSHYGFEIYCFPIASRLQDACHIGTQLILISRWKELPPSLWEVMGLIPVRDSDFSFVPRSSHVDQFTFHKTLRYIEMSVTWALTCSV